MQDGGAVIYTIRAWRPNATMEPLTLYRAHLANALDEALTLHASHLYTTISVTTPDSLELIKLWGQPMPDGKDWP
jgi:hypothetical protein